MNLKVIRLVFLMLLLLLFNFPGFSQVFQNMVRTQEQTFIEITKHISKEIPKDANILFYRPYILNIDDNISKDLSDNLELVLRSQQYVNNYEITFYDKVTIEDDKYPDDIQNSVTEEELVKLGKVFNCDVVLLINIFVQSDETKKVFNNETFQWENKNIAVIQGNIFETENYKIISRFFYRFTLNVY